MFLTIVIIFVVASVWDIAHVNRVIDNMVNPGRKQTHFR